MDAQEHLPYADDSTAATPLSEENGAILVHPFTWHHQSNNGSHFGTLSLSYPRELIKLTQQCDHLMI